MTRSRMPIFLLIALISGVSATAALAEEPARIRDMAITTSENDGRVEISLGDTVQPIITWVAADSCWRLDLPGVLAEDFDGKLLSTEFRGPLRQVWHGRVNADPPVERLNLYVKPGTGMKVTHTPAGFIVHLKVGMPLGAFSRNTGNRPLPAPLLLPGHGGGAVEINVRNAPLMPLLGELSEKAGITLRLRDEPPAYISFRIKSESAMSALQLLAKKAGLVLTSENGEWWLSSRKNPILKLPSSGHVSPATIQGITVRDALKRLGGRELGRKLCAGISDDLLAKQTGMVPDGLSPRAMAQYLRETY